MTQDRRIAIKTEIVCLRINMEAPTEQDRVNAGFRVAQAMSQCPSMDALEAFLNTLIMTPKQ